MVWILLLILLAAIFGLGTVLEATFWTLLIIAALAIMVVVGLARVLGH